MRKKGNEQGFGFLLSCLFGVLFLLFSVFLLGSISAGFDPGSICGNGITEDGEECDEGINGIDTDQCYDNCTYTYLGDGIKQCPNGGGVCEECDGEDLGGESCESQGFDSGSLSCDSGSFDTSDCNDEEDSICGNGVVDGDEDCDDGNSEDGDGCPADCSYINPTINDVILYVSQDYKKEHFLDENDDDNYADDDGIGDYEESGLKELVETEGKCLDCEDKGKIKGIITEYDDLEVKVNISVSDNSDFSPENYYVKFYLKGLWENAYPTQEINLKDCAKNGKSYICKTPVPFRGIDYLNGKRGRLIYAHADLLKKDKDENVSNGDSSYLVVAKFNYFFIPVSPGPKVNNSHLQYGFYSNISAVNNNLVDSAKPVYLQVDFFIPGEKGDFRKLVLSKTLDFFNNLYSINLGLSDDRIIAMSDYLGYDGAFVFDRNSILANPSTNPAYTNLVFLSSSTTTLAHELGHTYGKYTLCDEYTYDAQYNLFFQNIHGGYHAQKPCDNSYPSCCIDSPDNTLKKKFILLKEAKDYAITTSIVPPISSSVLYSFKELILKIRYDNPGIISEQEFFKFRNANPCVKVGGECIYNQGSSCPDDYFTLSSELGDSQYTSCPPESMHDLGLNPKCCISFSKLQELGESNCYKTFDKSKFGQPIQSNLNVILSVNCAGMPIPDSSVISSSYRSIMGFNLNQFSDKLRYPLEAMYPLNPNGN